MPRATLLEVRGEAIRWEREGYPGDVRECSYSLPSTYGLQCGVQGSSGPVPPPSSRSEIGKLRELLQRQQEQLNQLTQAVASLQPPKPVDRSTHKASAICRRCQRPGHFARECRNERVPHRARVTAMTSQPQDPVHSDADRKLKPTELRSHGSGGQLDGSVEERLGKLMSSCPTMDVPWGEWWFRAW